MYNDARPREIDVVALQREGIAKDPIDSVFIEVVAECRHTSLPRLVLKTDAVPEETPSAFVIATASARKLLNEMLEVDRVGFWDVPVAYGFNVV